jgi:multidrug efflux pump
VFSRFFIDRPIFATVLSLVVTIAGGVAVWTLPLAQYPQITPPSINVRCRYPGANAQVVAEAVGAPIEQQVNGVEGMLYMSSQSTNDGGYQLTVTFKPGVNLNMAQVLVQNRVNLALPVLPEVVKQSGILTRKRNPDILLIVSLVSPNHKYDQLYLNGYGTTNVIDELARVDGVSDVFMFGALNYSMRVWVDPDKLAARSLTAGDVVNALRQENAAVALGQVGQPPATKGQPYQFTLTTLGRLKEPSQFDEIVLRAMPDGSKVRIKDVGRCELGAQNMDITAKIDNKPCCNLAIFQLPDANALDTADRVRAKMQELKKQFPEGVDYIIAYDTTPFIRESIDGVFHTLRDATILVAVVVLVFLQNWRSALIPLVAVPVAIIGTFAAMALIGFSLNNLTLFGLVLAIGIVVDDAIVVVEAVEHHIEAGMSARDATIKAMGQVSGPVIAVGLVLCAVFVPCAFISGITGQFFRQFALTIAVSTVLSAFNSLTLSPALSALLLKPKKGRRDPVAWLFDLVLGWFFRLFNRGFAAAGSGYSRAVTMLLRRAGVVLVVYAGLLGLTWWGFHRLPTGYIPETDQGNLRLSVQMPDATALERTSEVVDKITEVCLSVEGVDHCLGTAGQSFVLSANGSNFGQMFVTLKDYRERRAPHLRSPAIAALLRKRLAQEVPDATVAVFGPPPVPGLGTGSGYKLIIEDRGDLGLPELEKATNRVIERANKADGLVGNFTVFRANSPQLYLDVNREQCFRLNVPLAGVFETLNVYLGSLYVNDFNRFGRTWQVNVQAEGEFRSEIAEVKRQKVRNRDGGMVPLGAVCDIERKDGPLVVARHNMYPAAPISGSTAPGISSGDAIRMLEAICEEELPASMAYDWTEITFMQIDAGKNIWNILIFPLAVAGVFLVLAAQYESWSLPLAVILVVPMCVLGSITGVAVAKGDINIFTQIGFVVLVGLASKNAILIVEFAKHLHEEGGKSAVEATLEACKLRLRPILMTSFAFILGVLPLVLANGAGAEMRRALGTAVFSGMLGVTVFGLFLTPVFFYAIERLGGARVFRSPLLAAINQISLDLISLRTVRRFVRERLAAARRPRTPGNGPRS